MLTRQQLRNGARPRPAGCGYAAAKRADSGWACLWVEDISGINRIGPAARRSTPFGENELIQAENELKRQRAEIEEKNRLMDACYGSSSRSSFSNQSAAGGRNRAEPETRLPAGRIRQAPGQPRADLRKKETVPARS